jgi:integrase
MRGTLRKRVGPRGTSWQLIVRVVDPTTGQRRQLARTVRLATRREAERELRAFVTEFEEGAVRAERRTVAGLLDAWHEHKAGRGRSITTLREYRRLIDRQLKPRFGDLPLERLTGRDLDRYYDELIAAGLAPATVRQVHAVMRGALGQAVKWDWLNTNPALKATPPPLRRPAVRAPEPDEVRLLIEKALAEDPAFGVFLRLAVVTGARRGELCALRWSDVDLGAAAVTIARSMAEDRGGRLVEKGTKTHAERLVSIDHETAAVMRQQLDRCQAASAACGVVLPRLAFVFSRKPDGSKPMHPNDATAAFGLLRAQLGISGIRLHDLRHFAATRLLVAGVPVRQVSGRLGHASASTTLNIYAHAVAELDAAAASVLAGVLDCPRSESSSGR